MSFPINAKSVYLYSDIDYSLNNVTTSDDMYELNSNQLLVISKDMGLLLNDVLDLDNYKIVIKEYSSNSNIKDINYNEKDGSFTYNPSLDTYGVVKYQYYIEYDNNISNKSIITFVVKKEIDYKVNYYEYITKTKISKSIYKIGYVGETITEKFKNIDGYTIYSPKNIKKKLSNDNNLNNFDFYYLPKTGLWK